MKMLICLHGNPLQGQEFEGLLPNLAKHGFNPILHKRPIKGSKLEPLLQSISATAKVSGGTPFGLVAYSWGAYLALAYLNRFPENVTGVVLINPLISEPKPEAEDHVLLSIPILRSIVLRMRKRRLAAEYMKQLFAPQDPLTEAKGQLESYLAQVPVWLGAEAYKKLMLTEPLNIMREGTIPIKILLGEMDPMAQGQKVLTDHYGKDSSLVVKGAGHALPWTHPDLVLDEIISQFKNSALQ